jgi:hypothetical protein
MDDLQIAFAKDKTLPFGPIDCSGSSGGTNPPPPPPSQTEACYLGKTRDGKTCDPTNPLPHADSDYDYPPPLSSQYAAPTRYLDLAAEDPSQYIAPNFQLSEIASEAKGQWAVVQTGAVEHLQNMRDAVGAIVVTSGYRSPGYNAVIDGSASSSRHMWGDGFDIEPVSASLSTLSSQCTKEGADYVSTYTDGHVHCDWRNDPLDPAFFGNSRMAPEWAEPDEIVADLLLEGSVFSAPAEGFDEGEPLRTWTAYDAAGEVIEIVESETYEAPAGAARIQVDVGNRVVLERDL